MHNQRNIEHNSVNKLFKLRERSIPYIILDSKNKFQQKMKNDFVIRIGILLEKSTSQFNKLFDYVKTTLEKNGIKVAKSNAGKGYLRIFPE